MIKKEYLITLLKLYSYRVSRVWEELRSNDFEHFVDADFALYLRNIIKNKRTKERFEEIEIVKADKNTKSIIRYCKDRDIQIITFEDDKYPNEKMNLIPLEQRPIVIYAKGNISLIKEEGVAIIGTRKIDEPYYKMGVELGKKLSYDYVINSGLAIGADTAAHKGALLGSGRTIAVLANGLNTIYPAANQILAQEIIENGGLIISEYPPYSKTQAYFFADRDRLQAALSVATIVVETGVKGGTMITVNYTQKYNKALLVVKPLNDEIIYNDKGNYELLKIKKTKEIDVNYSPEQIIENINTYYSAINKQQPVKQKTIKQYVWQKNIDMFKTETIYYLGGKRYKEIPDKYKIIEENEFEIITQLEED